ncbi:hypothetical protein ABIE90_003646 [Bradyrhizobium diazoefficiens]
MSGEICKCLARKRSPSAVSSMSCFFCLTRFRSAHGVEHLHAEIAGEMIVADARAPQRRILRSRAHAHVAGASGEARKPFEHAGNVVVGEAVVAMPALLLRLDQPAGLELRKVRARRLRRDAGLLRELARGQRASVHQRREHVGAGGVADQRSDHGDVGS